MASRWVHHVLSPEGLLNDGFTRTETAYVLPCRGPSSLRCNAQLTAVQASPLAGVKHIWQLLKEGHRPGTDPKECDKYGRGTIRAWLCERLSTLSTEERYALLRAAVSEDPPQLSGLASLLELEQRCEWQLNLNAYLQTPTGMFSLPALVLCNNDWSSADQVIGALRMLYDAGCDFRLPATLSSELQPCETLAHLVVAQPHAAEVLLLLRGLGAELDVRANLRPSGDQSAAWPTPLLDACTYGHLALVRTLHQCGADVCSETNLRSRRPCSAMHYASKNGHVDVMRYLWQHGVPVDHPTAGDATPLHLACEQGHEDAVRFLLSCGANLHRKDAKGASPFMLAFRGGHDAIVSYLRSSGVAGEIDPAVPVPPKAAARRTRKARRSTPMRVRAERAG